MKLFQLLLSKSVKIIKIIFGEVCMPPPMSLDSVPLRLIDISATDVFLGMTLAFAMCLVLARIYVFTSPIGATPTQLPRSMVLLGVTVSLIMAIIGNSLARAFGAIGALSLVRFRTAIKDPRDLVHVFMAIGIGMACGSGYFKIAIGASGLLCLFSLIVFKLPLTDSGLKVCLLRVQYPSSTDVETQILAILREKAPQVQVLAQENLDQQNLEMIIEITLPSSEDLNSVLTKLSGQTIKAQMLLS